MANNVIAVKVAVVMSFMCSSQEKSNSVMRDRGGCDPAPPAERSQNIVHHIFVKINTIYYFEFAMANLCGQPLNSLCDTQNSKTLHIFQVVVLRWLKDRQQNKAANELDINTIYSRMTFY
jgi:hypothetical protein